VGRYPAIFARCGGGSPCRVVMFVFVITVKKSFSGCDGIYTISALKTHLYTE
jgi:hypothetical protein